MKKFSLFHTPPLCVSRYKYPPLYFTLFFLVAYSKYYIYRIQCSLYCRNHQSIFVWIKSTIKYPHDCLWITSYVYSDNDNIILMLRFILQLRFGSFKSLF